MVGVQQENNGGFFKLGIFKGALHMLKKTGDQTAQGAQAAIQTENDQGAQAARQMQTAGGALLQNLTADSNKVVKSQQENFTEDVNKFLNGKLEPWQQNILSRLGKLSEVDAINIKLVTDYVRKNFEALSLLKKPLNNLTTQDLQEARATYEAKEAKASEAREVLKAAKAAYEAKEAKASEAFKAIQKATTADDIKEAKAAYDAKYCEASEAFKALEAPRADYEAKDCEARKAAKALEAARADYEAKVDQNIKEMTEELMLSQNIDQIIHQYLQNENKNYEGREPKKIQTEEDVGVPRKPWLGEDVDEESISVEVKQLMEHYSPRSVDGKNHEVEAEFAKDHICMKGVSVCGLILNHFLVDDFKELIKKYENDGLASTMFNHTVMKLDVAKKVKGLVDNVMSLIKESQANNPDAEKVFTYFIGVLADMTGVMKEIMNLKDFSFSTPEAIMNPIKNLGEANLHKLFEQSNISEDQYKSLQNNINTIDAIISAIQNDMKGYDATKGLDDGAAIVGQIKNEIEMKRGENFAQKTQNVVNTTALISTLVRIGYKLSHNDGGETQKSIEEMNEVEKMATDYKAVKGFCDQLAMVASFISPFVKGIPIFSAVADRVIHFIPELFLQQQVNDGLMKPTEAGKLAKANKFINDGMLKGVAAVSEGVAAVSEALFGPDSLFDDIKGIGEVFRHDFSEFGEAIENTNVGRFVRRKVKDVGETVKDGVKKITPELTDEAQAALGKETKTVETAKTHLDKSRKEYIQTLIDCDSAGTSADNLKDAEKKYNKAKGRNNNSKVTSFADVKYKPVSEGPRFMGI